MSSAIGTDVIAEQALKRLMVLKLAEELGSVAEACRRTGMDRTSFYAWKRRFQTRGLDGLKDLPPVAKSHPFTTPAETVAKILFLASQHPAWGCHRLSAHLAQAGITLSPVTIQSLLNKNGLGNLEERLLKLEVMAVREKVLLTREQIQLIEKANPAFKERHAESSRPGELLSQSSFYCRSIKDTNKVYVHTVVDTFNSYAFASLFTSEQQEMAVTLLHGTVLPFYRKHKIPIAAIFTKNAPEYCRAKASDPAMPLFELYLLLNNIRHKRTNSVRQQVNGFTARFHRTVCDEFLLPTLRTMPDLSIRELQTNLDEWLQNYNHERPHRGYPNMGKRPVDLLNEFLAVPQGP